MKITKGFIRSFLHLLCLKEFLTYLHISGTCRITTMNELPFYQTILSTECLTIPISYTQTQHYAW